MNASPHATPSKAFLSSSSGLLRAGDVRRSGLRWDLWLDGGSDASEVFVAEYAWERFDESNHPHLEIAINLLAQVRASSRFVLLLYGDRPGSRLAVQDEALITTFLELEIFQAILLDKPVFLLTHDSFSGSASGRYLDILTMLVPSWRDGATSRVMSNAQVRSAVRTIAAGGGLEWKCRLARQPSARMHIRLAMQRDHHYTRESRPQSHFMQIDRVPQRSLGKKVVNEDAVQALLSARRPQDKFQGNDRRLAMAWLLTRELMEGPLFGVDGRIIERNPLVLAGWNAALVDWHSAASWHGLHSHVHLGTVPTVNTIAAIREQIRRAQIEDAVGGSVEPPRGLYSTSYYSLAKRVPLKFKQELLRFAKDALVGDRTEAEVLATPDDMNMLASIELARGRGAEAISLFERSLSVLRLSGASHNEEGMVLGELAFARSVLGGDSARAMAEAQDAVRLLRRHDAQGSPLVDGFLVRALFKSAAVHLRAGMVGVAAALYLEAYRASESQHYDDQLGQWAPAALLRRTVDRASWNSVLQSLGLVRSGAV